LPGDIPLVTSAEIETVLLAGSIQPSFVIVPAWDERGSNAILASPPGVVPLKYGNDSFFPHLMRAEALGISPSILRLPGIASDIDTPRDLGVFLGESSGTRARALLNERHFAFPAEQRLTRRSLEEN
jgi:2-phospho-L-lactate guanylyltransferase